MNYREMKDWFGKVESETNKREIFQVVFVRLLFEVYGSLDSIAVDLRKLRELVEAESERADRKGGGQ
jgi:hypothetical protein